MRAAAAEVNEDRVAHLSDAAQPQRAQLGQRGSELLQRAAAGDARPARAKVEVLEGGAAREEQHARVGDPVRRPEP